MASDCVLFPGMANFFSHNELSEWLRFKGLTISSVVKDWSKQNFHAAGGDVNCYEHAGNMCQYLLKLNVLIVYNPQFPSRLLPMGTECSAAPQNTYKKLYSQ